MSVEEKQETKDLTERKEESTKKTTSGGGSHRSHSHHRRRRRKSSFLNDVRHWFDKRFGRHSSLVMNLLAIFIALILVGGLTAVNLIAMASKKPSGSDGTNSDANSQKPPSVQDEASVQLQMPYFSEDVELASEAAVIYLSGNADANLVSIIERYQRGSRLDIGKPVVFEFELLSAPAKLSNALVKLRISENADFADAQEWTLEQGQKSLAVYNLKTATKYYYRICYGDSEQFVQGVFRTADTRRFMNVAGAVNVRDIGGIKTTDGKTIRQGLLYRGSELDGAVESKFLLQYDGRNTMLNTMKIRFDMDLRVPSGVDALGNTVQHGNYDAPAYGGIFTEEGKAKIRAIFADLADVNNYPIYMHCTYGMDRTGTVCYLLEALLGASDEDLMKDYRLSAIYHGGTVTSVETIAPLINGLAMYEGTSTREKVENYLLSAGVTAEEISNLREILLG